MKIRDLKRNKRIPALALSVALAAGLSAAVVEPASADPAHTYMIVGGTGSSNIGVLRETPTGFTQVPGSPFPAATGTLSIAASPNGRYVYVAHTISGSLYGYRMHPNGSLTPLPGVRLELGQPTVGVIMSPDGKTLFATVGSTSSSVRSYAVGNDGSLRRTGHPDAPMAGLSGLAIPTVAPDGKHLYVTSFVHSTIDSFAIGSGGALTWLGRQPTGSRPTMPEVTPDGRFAYISNEGTNDLSVYAVQGNGALRLIGAVPTGGTPHGVAFTADGKRLYLPASTSMGVQGFNILPNGLLTPIPGSQVTAPLGYVPARVVLSKDGKRLYAVDTLNVAGTARILTYDIHPNGSLSLSRNPVADSGVIYSDGPVSLLVTPH